jgi:N-acetylneuraminic acid mutarotase
VAVSCASATVNVGQTSQCSATVQGTGSFSSAVTWAVSGVQGGNATVGTVSTAGLYTAPATVPTPFTVALTATSVTDTTKSASSPLIVAGKIASVSQTISASAGGTITLPDGSSVTIPAGLLAADQTVTLSENSVPLNQPQNQLLAGIGPALYLSFSGQLQPQSTATRDTAGISRSATSGGLLAGLSFNFNFGVNLPSVASTAAALASFANQAGAVLYQGISDTIDATTQTADAVVSQGCLSAIGGALGSATAAKLTIGVYFVDLAARPVNAPTQGLLVWTPTAGQFLPFVPSQQCPAPATSGQKTLVVIHGMLSSVESSYTNMLGTTNFLSKGNYGPVFGIDYEWWNGLQQNGKTVAGYLDQIAACSPGVPIDILAHSEGVPVTISALTQDTAAKSSVQHFITVAGPILGTPLANAVAGPLGTGRYALLTAIGNFPFLQMVFPPESIGGMQGLLNSQFAADLATDSSGSGVLQSVRNKWLQDQTLSQVPVVMVGGTFPDPKVAGEYIPLGACINNCFGDFTQEPFDGVVGLDSAFGAGLNIPLYRIPALPLFHTEMVGNIGVLEDLELQLNNSQPPKLEITTFSTDASCVDSHSCSGPPGSVFTFTGSGFTPGKPLSIYVQDTTGTEDTPIVVTAQADGTLTWTDPTPPSKVPGNYGVWVYDPDSGASISVIETICSANCPSSTPTAAITVSPVAVQVPVSGHQAFTPTVTGLSNTAVTWSVNGSIGGDTTVGTISAAGLYTAPTTVPSPTTVTVTATSQADASVSGSASVTIEPSGAVTVSPASVALAEGGTQQFTATISGGGTVNWTVTGGTADGTITSAGLYTAPNTTGMFYVIATNAADTSQSFTATVTVTAPSSNPNEWTWMSGSDRAFALGVYGTKGVPAATNIPGSRNGAVSWTDSKGDLWLFGGYGSDATGAQDPLNDLWEFNPITKEWTWVSGSQTIGANGVYGTRGTPAANNVPGGRVWATGWIDSSGNLWLFGGQGNDSIGMTGYLNDLWEFDPSTQEWTWISGGIAADLGGVYGTLGVPSTTNMPGGRYFTSSWIDRDGDFWVFGGDGLDSTGFYGQLNDLWEFNATSKTWIWISGAATVDSIGIYGTLGTPSTTNTPGSRYGTASWIDNSGDLWLFGGYGTGTGFLNDLWKFDPSAKTWTWVGGSNVGGALGIYGTQGVAAAANFPGSRYIALSWTDKNGNLWLFGGDGVDITGAQGDLNDLWEFNPASKEWTWVSGGDMTRAYGVYGTLGAPSAANVPGSRDTAVGWIDTSGDLWMFAGEGFDSTGMFGTLNDLWRYQP